MATGHPGEDGKFAQTLCHGRNKATVFEDVLRRQVAREDTAASTVLNARAEDLLGEQQAEAVVKQHPMAVVREMSLGGIEPLVQREIVLSHAAPLLRGSLGVNERIAHDSPRSSFELSFST